MGLITAVLTLPLLPVRGVAWLADQVLAQADGELAGREAVYQRLSEVQRALADGEITADEAAEREQHIIDELREKYGEGF